MHIDEATDILIRVFENDEKFISVTARRAAIKQVLYEFSKDEVKSAIKEFKKQITDMEFEYE